MGDRRDVKSYIEAEFGYDLSGACDEIRPNYRHVESCQETVPEEPEKEAMKRLTKDLREMVGKCRKAIKYMD